MGDALDASEQSMYNFDTMAVHHAFQQVVQDNQGVDGDVPVVVPAGFSGNNSCNDIAWTSAYPQITNMLHHYCKCSRSLCVFFRSLKERPRRRRYANHPSALGLARLLPGEPHRPRGADTR